MAETISDSIQSANETRIRRLVRQLRNPVTVKELRSRMRGRRAFVVLTTYLTIMSGLIILIYLAFLNSSARTGTETQIAGKTLFTTVIGIQGFLVLFVAPAFTAGAISSEKERQTFDLLRTTLLSAPSFVIGKLLSSLSYVILLILAAIPLQSFAFLLGGVTLIELFLSQVILIVAVLAVAMFGLFCSARMRTTLSASVLTFAGVLFVTFGLPALAGLFTLIMAPILAGIATATTAWEIGATYAGIFLSAFNLPATLIISDFLLVEEGAIFFTTMPLGGRSVIVISPWPLFILFYLLISLGLYWATVRRVRKVAIE